MAYGRRKTSLRRKTIAIEKKKRNNYVEPIHRSHARSGLSINKSPYSTFAGNIAYTPLPLHTYTQSQPTSSINYYVARASEIVDRSDIAEAIESTIPSF